MERRVVVVFGSISALGYCINLGTDNMLELLAEYQKMTGFKKIEVKK